jgi:hypothetical protein
MDKFERSSELFQEITKKMTDEGFILPEMSGFFMSGFCTFFAEMLKNPAIKEKEIDEEIDNGLKIVKQGVIRLLDRMEPKE